MFTIYDGNTKFNQWQTEQRVTEPSLMPGDNVVFMNPSGATYVMKAYIHGGKIVADVPNKLLTTAVPIVVYRNGHYETRTQFTVNAQTKPEDYVLTDNANGYFDDSTPVVLALEDYGIDVFGVIAAGGGQVTLTGDERYRAFWEHLRLVQNNVALSVQLSDRIKVVALPINVSYYMGYGPIPCAITVRCMIANESVATNVELRLSGNHINNPDMGIFGYEDVCHVLAVVTQHNLA